jgi:SWI/SNF-related matrix-associated actin-dependent regulator of chromatin subfamily A3
LKLVSRLLDIYGLRFTMIDGSLSLNDRLKVLKDFKSPNGANLLLMTLGTGAVGYIISLLG